MRSKNDAIALDPVIVARVATLVDRMMPRNEMELSFTDFMYRYVKALKRFHGVRWHINEAIKALEEDNIRQAVEDLCEAVLLDRCLRLTTDAERYAFLQSLATQDFSQTISFVNAAVRFYQRCNRQALKQKRDKKHSKFPEWQADQVLPELASPTGIKPLPLLDTNVPQPTGVDGRDFAEAALEPSFKRPDSGRGTQSRHYGRAPNSAEHSSLFPSGSRDTSQVQ
jgi:hypothetical protein